MNIEFTENELYKYFLLAVNIPALYEYDSCV